ncbi:MAG: hypothetical protein V4772_07140 [Pseudomonadota bacterium]
MKNQKNAPGVSRATNVGEFDPAFEMQVDLHRLKAVTWMLFRIYGGEVSADDRPPENDVACAIQYIHTVICRVQGLSEQLSNYSSDLDDSIFEAKGIASTLDAMTWSAGMRIVGSDEMMAGLFSAIRECVDRCELALDKGPEVVPAKPRPPVHVTQQRQSGKILKAAPQGDAAKAATLATI